MKSPNLYTKKSLISFFALYAICMMGFANSGHSTNAPAVLAGNQVEVQISTGSDDAEENISTGGVAHTSSDLELVTDGSAQLVGMRFQAVNVPQGARIVAAYIEFECDENSSGASFLTIKGQAIDDAPTFSTTSGNISSRATTSATTPWSPAATWTVNSKYKTSNFANVVQEIVDRSGWNANNDMAIIISGSGSRIAESYDGEAAAAPKLVVVYDNVVNTANLLKYSVQTENDAELFSYDPDPTCASADWAADWTKFTVPGGFEFEEYDDGSLVAFGTFVGLANTNDRWDAYFRFENKRTWAEWDAMGRMFYQSGSGSCNANHVDWHYYEIDSLTSRIIGTAGYDNEGKYSKIRHNPTDYIKGTQVGFGANNQDGGYSITCQTYDIRGWCNFSGDLNLQCADFGFNIAGYEENNPCLISNGDFEDDLDYWYTEAPSGEVFITSDAYSGNKAVRISGESRSLDLLKSPAVPGESYMFSGYGKKDAGVGWTSMAMRFYDKNHNQLFLNASEVKNSSYRFLNVGGIAPANAAFVDVQLWKGNGAGNATFDDVCLRRMPNPAGANCESITNSGFESAIGTEWSPWGTVTQTTDAVEGTYAALIGGGVDGGISSSVSASPNKDYKFSINLKETGTIGWSGVGITFYDASWNELSSSLSDAFSGTYQNYEIVMQSPANTAFMGFWVSKYGTGDLYADGICFNEIYSVEDCSNGKDDDGDGLVDENDPDCQGCVGSFLSNNGFENDLTGWSSSGVVTVTSDAAVGTKAITVDNASGSGGVWQDAPATHGDVFTLTGFAKSSSGTDLNYLTTIGVEYFNSEGFKILDVTETIKTNSYQQYTIAAMAPEDATTVRAVAWNNADVPGVAHWDELCLTKYTLTPTTCSGNSCLGLPSFSNTIYAIDISNNDEWLNYDNGDLKICDNGDGTFNIKGHIVNGNFADWSANPGSPCGGDDGWYIDLHVFDMQSWEEFQQAYVTNASCPEKYVGLDYWNVTGTYTGTGCNTGRVVTINGPATASGGTYRLQAGWGGNSHGCGVGISTWFSGTIDGHGVGSDIYMNLDPQCYWEMRPRKSCENYAANGEFDFDNDGWYLATQSGNTATLTNDNTSQLSGTNAARIDIASITGTGWHVQLIQENKTIESGETYTFSFDAKAAANRDIILRIQDDATPWATHFSHTFSITTTNQNYTIDYTSAANKYGDVRLVFDLGQSSETVYIDNVIMSGPCDESCETIDFDTDPSGNSVASESDPREIWASMGVHFSTNDQANRPLSIFDASNPPSFELDLGSPNEDFGGPGIGAAGGAGSAGQHSQALGNLMIISQSPSQLNNSYNWGGTIIIDFDTNKFVETIELLDINETRDSEVRIYDVNGTLLNTITTEGFGDNGYQKVDINHLGVRKMEISADLSFALVGLSYCDDKSEICGNGLDDDGDGFTDCEDSDCSGAQNKNPLELAADFNFFVEQDVILKNGDIEGPVALGGDLTINGNMAVASNQRGTYFAPGDTRETGLYIGGGINFQSGSGVNVNRSTYVKLGNQSGANIHDMNGSSTALTRITPGNYDAQPRVSLQVHQPSASVTTDGGINFSNRFGQIREYSNYLAYAPEVGTLSVSGTTGTISLDWNKTNIINTTAAEWGNINTLIFDDKPNGSTPLIINVNASGNFNWNVPTFNAVGDSQGPYIILNFFNTTNLVLNGSNTITGSLLAPNANVVKNTSGNINGQMVSKSFEMVSGELHDHVFNSTINFEYCNLEICGNGIDDDNDGSADKDDPDCFSCAAGLLTNPDFSNEFTGWNTSGVYSIETELNGNKFARFPTTGGVSQNYTAVPNAEYKLKFLARSENLGRASAGFSFYDAGGALIGGHYTVSIINSDFREYFRTAIAPANAATIRVFTYTQSNNTADYDGFCLTEGVLEICDNSIDDDGDGLIDIDDPDCGPNCALTNPDPAFPLDMNGDNNGWIDYNFAEDFILSDNGDGSMHITGTLINGTPVDFGGGSTASSCGANDTWAVSLNLTDKMNWTEWQATGGGAYLNQYCYGNEANWDYWDVTGTITGTGCNTGRTLTVNGPVNGYRLQVGWGGNSNDTNCEFGFSTWFSISEGGNSISGDIYSFLDASCYNPSDCSVNITDISVSNCIDHPMEDVATVDVTLEWQDAPANDTIELLLNGKTEFIDVAGGVVSPHTIELMVLADGSTNIPISASWRNSNSCPGDSETFDAPSSCSSGGINCSILYLCGDNKYQDAEPWDYGMVEYLDRINGTATLTPAATKADATGYGLYNPMNTSVALTIDLDDYDLIIVSPSVGTQHTNDLVNAMKTFEGGILNMQRTISDDLGLSAGDGWIEYKNVVYSDDTNNFVYSNYDNADPVWEQIQTVYSYHTGIGEDAYLWSAEYSMTPEQNGVFIAYDKNDVLPGISSHGARVQLGYHLDGFYYGHLDDDPLPSLPVSWFDPTKHLTERGKYYLEQALVLASAECGLEPEICTDGIDNDGDGQIDCADSDCSGTLSVSSSIPVIGCGGGGSQIDLVTMGTLPYSYVWSDMAPTAQWTFESTTNDVSGNAHHQNGGQTNSFAYSNDRMQGNYAGEFSGDDYVRYSVDGGFMEVTFSKYSFSGWIKPANLTGIKTIIDEGGGTNGIAFRLNDNKLEGAVRHGGVQVNSNVLTFPNDGDWHHVAMVFDGGVFTIYLDGTASTPVTATYSLVGNHSGNGGLGYYDSGSGFGGGSGNYFVGWMDDVRLFIGQALNPNQIADVARNDGDRYHLQDGSYTVTVTNGAHCVDTENETVPITNYVNVTDGGTVAANQSICSGDTPALLTSTTAASGGSGLTIEYEWESSTDNTTWTIVGGATALTYQPGALTQTTYYRRGASRDGCSNKLYSNVLTITIVDNATDPGSIIGVEEKCGSYDPMEISSLGAASGGQGGTIQYQWESSTDNATWTNISGAVTETFNPPTITQTTYYRRKARRSSCAAYLISNVVEKTVVTNFNNGGTIGSDESVCGPFDPINVMNIAGPSGGANGSVQYRWELRTTGLWAVIPGAISYSYDPSTITETTEYRRLSRRSPCSNWIYSNTVKKEVVGEPTATIATAPLGKVCGNVSYLFLASDAGSTSATYLWDFGPYATPSVAAGIGPHSVIFDIPSTSTSSTFDVDLDVRMNGCSKSDQLSLTGKAFIDTTGIAPRHPSSCGGTDGEIDITALYPAGTNIQVSLDGGTTWETAGQLVFTGLGAGNYNIHMRYSDGDCDYNYGTITLREPTSPNSGINEDYDVECNSTTKTFSAIIDASIDSYSWNFGIDASPATATGPGPHSVTYSSTEAKTVSLQVSASGCTAAYTEDFHLVNGLTNGGEIAADQFLCSDPDPNVLNNVVAASGGSGGNIIYQWQLRTKLNPNVWGAWQNIPGADQMEYDPGVLTEVTQYRRVAFREGCPDRVESNVIVVTPSTSPIANGESFTSVCPGQTFAENVSLNDVDVQNASYSIEVPATNGTVTIFSDGTFYYDPNTTFCGVDQFTYEVCSDNGSCCDTAIVRLNLTDTEAPLLENIPDDITIHCDEEVPLPPFVRALENCLTVSLGLDEISTQGIDTCSLYDYEITRIWTATDYCGNAASDSQKITVEDITAPDIYRIYTLPNGKKMVAGVMENVGEHWKYISLPISFPSKPVIFTQVTSEVDDSTAVVQLRNISSSQFEIRLREEEALDGKHGRESVAWFAMEQGAMSEGEVKEVTASIGGSSIGFGQNYGANPIFLTSLQSTFENDPAAIKVANLTGSGASVTLNEEQSADTETNHIDEKLAYLAMKNNGNLTLASGEVYGEVGVEYISTTWGTITLTNKYHNPVVIANVNSSNGDQPHVRIKNVTTTSFDIKLEEWEYNDGNHGFEDISYMVVEGSIPFDGSFACDDIPNPLQEGSELIAVDNCDLTVKMIYTEVLNPDNCAPDNELVRTWTSTDECGNSTSYTHTLSIYDNVDPTFTVPADVTVSCLDDIDDLTLTGDVTDEADNCETDLDATYNDIFLTPFTCDSSFTVYREWTLEDKCGNSVTKTQHINIIHQGVSIRLKMFLQGALHGSTDGLMRDDLRQLGVLPTTEPYSGFANFLHIGEGGGEVVNPAVFSVTGPDAIVDWVFVEIRNGVKNDSVIGTRSALLQRDGDVVDLDGISPVKFGVVQPGNYNVAIRHRNHLGAMTKRTRILSDDPGSSKIDFADLDAQIIIDTTTSGYGWQDIDQDDEFILCDQGVTKYVNGVAAQALQANGAICGPCGDYVSVADGPWESSTTWLNGMVPPNDIDGQSIRINHLVTHSHGAGLLVKTGGIIWVEDGQLSVNYEFALQGGQAYFYNSDINIDVNLRIQAISGGDTKLIQKGGSLTIGNYLQTIGNVESYYENVCMNVANNIILEDGIHWLRNTCINMTEGTFENRNNSDVHFVDSKIHIALGSVVNQGSLSGNLKALWVESGTVSNTNPVNWSAQIEEFCFGHGIFSINGINDQYKPISMTCGGMADIFAVNDCDLIIPGTLTENPLEELVHGKDPLIKIGNVYANWAADLNKDRQAIYQGPSNDITTLLVQVITDTNNTNHLPNFIRKAYDTADLDMDGDVIYQGPDNDRSKLLFHVILRHPDNTSSLPNFIIQEQLPR